MRSGSPKGCLALKECVKEIPPSSIHYASRISNGRICLCLDSEESANSLVSSGFSIIGFFVEVRRLDVQSRKLVLSNVAPESPDSILLDALSQLEKITSVFS